MGDATTDRCGGCLRQEEHFPNPHEGSFRPRDPAAGVMKNGGIQKPMAVKKGVVSGQAFIEGPPNFSKKLAQPDAGDVTSHGAPPALVAHLRGD